MQNKVNFVKAWKSNRYVQINHLLPGGKYLVHIKGEITTSALIFQPKQQYCPVSLCPPSLSPVAITLVQFHNISPQKSPKSRYQTAWNFLQNSGKSVVHQVLGDFSQPSRQQIYKQRQWHRWWHSKNSQFRRYESPAAAVDRARLTYYNNLALHTQYLLICTISKVKCLTCAPTTLVLYWNFHRHMKDKRFYINTSLLRLQYIFVFILSVSIQ